MSKLLEKLGFTPDWKAVKFKARGFNGVETNEVHFGDYGECVAEYVYEDKDALLIASAPEMLEALVDTLVDVEFYYDLSVGGKPPFAEAYSEALSILQKALDMTWDEIKEQIDVRATDLRHGD